VKVEAGTLTTRPTVTRCKSMPCAIASLTCSRLPILTNVEYTGISLDSRRGLVIHVTADAPPGRARAGTPKARAEFWEAGKRMPQGGLVAVITKNKGGTGAQEMEVAIATLTISTSHPTTADGLLTPRPSVIPQHQRPRRRPSPLQLRAPLHRRPRRHGGSAHLPARRAPPR
jgi:hypothetical protein